MVASLNDLQIKNLKIYINFALEVVRGKKTLADAYKKFKSKYHIFLVVYEKVKVIGDDVKQATRTAMGTYNFAKFSAEMNNHLKDLEDWINGKKLDSEGRASASIEIAGVKATLSEHVINHIGINAFNVQLTKESSFEKALAHKINGTKFISLINGQATDRNEWLAPGQEPIYQLTELNKLALNSYIWEVLKGDTLKKMTAKYLVGELLLNLFDI